MNRQELKTVIMENYNAINDFPWKNYPTYEVFRHPSNKKWFAVIMDLPREKLGLNGKEVITVVNFKCEQFMIESLLMEDGFFPGYHMNKKHWITVLLDGTVPDEKIRMLLDMSFDATAPKIRMYKGGKQ